MKATDLMIGDYVRYIGTETFGDMKNGDIVKVDALQGNYICVGDGWAYGDMFEPIPLTLEILQKNGFKTDGEAIWASFCPEDNEFALEISEPNYYDENYGEREYWWTINACEYSIIPLRYVHELQHALKLCGIDKNIEL